MSERIRITAPQSDTLVDQLPTRRSRRLGVRGAIGAGLLVVAAACSPNTESASGSSSQTSPETPPTPTVTWDGTAPETVPYPGRVALPDATCKVWGLDKPQPVIARDDLMLAVVDARRSVPPQCDYLVDTGAGARKGASYTAPIQKQPEGDQWIPDGTVVDINGYSIGQAACNDAGVSTLWVRFEREPNGPDSWLPVINTGGGPTRAELEQNNIPPVQSPYEGTVHANC